jgi:predicted kinase
MNTTLVLVAGLPGTGKTYFAERLATQLQAHHLNTDGTRERLGLTGQYAPEIKQQVYHSLYQLTRQYLYWGEGVVLDATFHLASRRAEALELAQQAQVPCRMIRITARDNLIRNRLDRPRPDSEADEEVYDSLRVTEEPILHPHLVLISGDQTIDEMVHMGAHFVQMA